MRKQQRQKKGQKKPGDATNPAGVTDQLYRDVSYERATELVRWKEDIKEIRVPTDI